MTHLIAMIQCGSENTTAQNLLKASGYISRASAAKAELAVFPEYFMLSDLIDAKAYAAAAEPLDGSFVSEMKELARQYHIWLLFGINELAPQNAGKKSYNTLVLLDEQGTIQGTYRKTHLFDAFDWKESDSALPGETLFPPLQTPFGKLGLCTCYDLRFPEPARCAALLGADILIYPSAWVAGDLKAQQWDHLLAARAIENGMFILGVSQYIPDTYIGQSRAYSPLGKCLAQGGDCEEMLLVSLYPEEVKKAREAIPALLNRRTDLY